MAVSLISPAQQKRRRKYFWFLTVLFSSVTVSGVLGTVESLIGRDDYQLDMSD